MDWKQLSLRESKDNKPTRLSLITDRYKIPYKWQLVTNLIKLLSEKCENLRSTGLHVLRFSALLCFLLQAIYFLRLWVFQCFISSLHFPVIPNSNLGSVGSLYLGNRSAVDRTGSTARSLRVTQVAGAAKWVVIKSTARTHPGTDFISCVAYGQLRSESVAE